MLRPRGAHAPELVGRGRGDTATERRQKLLRHRMRRHADGHGVLPAGDDVVHVRAALHHHGERARPELLGELRRDFRHFGHPTVQEARRVEMHDDRMGFRATLGFENLGDRRRVLRIGAEPVDGFSRKSHELAVAQSLHGGLDLDLCCPNDANHMGPGF